MGNETNRTVYINGGQVNIAKDKAVINAVQNNHTDEKERNNIIKNILENLSELKKEDADEIADVVDMLNKELIEPEPKASRLRNCLALIAPMLSITNGVPVLMENLQKLYDIVMQHLK